MKQRSFSYAKYGYLFSIPFVVVFCIFNLYPTVYTAILGFTDCKGLGNTDWNFLTEEPFKNFEQILKNPSFITAVKNTFKIWMMNFIP
jgi:multiple sugar transport system permease protein